MKLSPGEGLVRAIFGIDRKFVDFPYLVGSDDQILALLCQSDLSPREQRVLVLRFGFDSGRARTLREVGSEFLSPVSAERIRQIEAKALRKLRHSLRSRNFEPFLYRPSKDDTRAIAMRERLANELLKFYPKKDLAYEITMGIKRPYLKRALRDLARGNVAKQVRLSCGLTMRHCKQCGAITLPNWDFCSRECQKAYRTITVICDECGQPFPRSAAQVAYRLGKLPFHHSFCSKHCTGKYIGKLNRKPTKRKKNGTGTWYG